MYIKYIKSSSYKNLFFHFSFLQNLNREARQKRFDLKNLPFFFQLESFADKSNNSISTHSTKLMILLLLSMILRYFTQFV